MVGREGEGGKTRCEEKVLESTMCREEEEKQENVYIFLIVFLSLELLQERIDKFRPWCFLTCECVQGFVDWLSMLGPPNIDMTILVDY